MEQGCTMLAQHHSCGSPLFRCKGNILCPVCSFETEKLVDAQTNEAGAAASKPARASKDTNQREISPGAVPIINHAKENQENEQAIAQSPESGSIISDQDSMKMITISGPEINALLKKTLLFELKELSDNIRKEQDPNRLRAMLDCIEVALRILSSLNKEK